MSTTAAVFRGVEPAAAVGTKSVRAGRLLLFSAFSAHLLGEPRMGGRLGGVNRPDLEPRNGDERGEMVHGGVCWGGNL